MWFVKFYAPWCGHCKALESDWAQLAERLGGRVVVARLDGTENPVTMDRFDQHVRGFPTLLLFRDRGVYTFDGPRVVDAMETFALESYASARRRDVPPEPTRSGGGTATSPKCSPWRSCARTTPGRWG